jgi:hypothetical protein
VVAIISAAAMVARMTAFASVETALLKHICLVGNSGQNYSGFDESKPGSSFMILTRFLDANRYPLRSKTL